MRVTRQRLWGGWVELRKGIMEVVFALKLGRQGPDLAKIMGKNIPG